MANNSEFIINTTLNTNGVDAGANRVNSKMKNLGRSVEQTSNRMSQSMNRAFTDNRVKTAPYEALEKRLAQITAKYDQLAEKEHRFLSTGGSEKSTTYRRMEYDLDKIEQEQDSIIAKMRQMETAGTAYQSAPIRQVGAEAEGAASRLTALDSAQRSSNSSAKKASHIFKGLSKAFGKHNVSVGKTFKNVLKYAFGIRSLFVLFNRLRRGLIEGFNNLARFNNGINPTNTALSNLKSALTQLKNSFATAFNPILVTIEPILTGFINKLSEAVTMLGMFFAKLTGAKTFTKAKKVQEQYAQATGDSAKAQEKLNEKLADYDKLDVIQQDNKSNAGSGGAGGVSPNDMFEEVALDDSAVEWAEKFKKAWETADFTEIGSIVGNKIKNALDSIDWAPIKKTADKLGKSFATFLNGFFETPGFSQTVGKTLGEGINTGLTLISSFLNNRHFDSVGKFISSGLQTAFQTIDFSTIGSTLSGAISGIFDTISGIIQGIDWTQLPKDIFDAIVEFIDGFDFKKIAKSIAKMLGSAIGAVAGFIVGIGKLVADLAKKIVDAWEDKKDEWESMGKSVWEGLGEGILNAIKSVGSWIYNNLFKPFIDAFKKAFGIHSPSTVMAEMGGYIMQGLYNGVKKKIKIIKEIFQKVLSTIKGVFDGITTWFGSKFSGAWDKVKNAFKPNAAAKFFRGVVSNIKSAFSGIASWFQTTFSTAWTKVKNVFSKGGKIFVGIKNGILNGLKVVINGLISGINKVIAIPFRGINAALNKIKSISILGAKPFSGLPTIYVPQIPKLAKGAVIPPNQEFLAMLGDQKRGVNIETPLETMIQAFQTALDNRGGASMPDKLEITLANGKSIAEVVWDESEKKYKQTGFMPRYI